MGYLASEDISHMAFCDRLRICNMGYMGLQHAMQPVMLILTYRRSSYKNSNSWIVPYNYCETPIS